MHAVGNWKHWTSILMMVCAAAAHGATDKYPSKPAHLILPFGAGGSTDIIGRIFAQYFSEAWGQTVVIDNRAGAAGIVGTELAARAAPDGYTLFTYGINQAITPALYKKLPYESLRDFSLISLYATMPNILCITNSFPTTNVSEYVKVVKASPGKYKFASSGVGASPHLTMEYFMSVTGLKQIHVPYKNSSQGYLDTIAGEIQSFFFNLPGPLPHVKAGRLRALAVTSAKRAPQVPDLPTIMESGIPDFEVTVWQGYAVQKSTPQPIVQNLHAAMIKALAVPELQKKFFDAGVSAAPVSPAEFTKFAANEIAKWKKVVAISGAKVE